MVAPSPSCVRRAWLDLTGDGSRTLPLDNPAGGWFCTSLDLGYPNVREVISNRPDQPGADDRTTLGGSRVVSADITALVGAGARIDDVASRFAPYMMPSARPVLHFVLDRPGVAERVITLRASGYAWPIVGANQRDIQLQWVAADPAVYDPVTKQATSWTGASTAAGRVYNLTFNRVYPAGGGGQVNSILRSAGDYPILPLLRFYGPTTSPGARWMWVGQIGQPSVFFNTGYIINAGHYVEVDTARKTAWLDGDHSQPQLGNLNWANTQWPVLPTGTDVTMTPYGQTTSGVTQVQAFWQDRYMT